MVLDSLLLLGVRSFRGFVVDDTQERAQFSVVTVKQNVFYGWWLYLQPPTAVLFQELLSFP